MTQVATPAAIIPKLEGVRLELDEWVYRVTRREDTYFVQKHPVGKSEAEFDSPRQIVLLTGSHNMQFFWMETGQGRTLEHFPFGWLTGEKRWAPLDDTFLCPPEYHGLASTVHATGDWNGGCIDCHTTQGRSKRSDDGVFDSEVTEFGISCEACHGSGAEHIARQQNPVRRYWAYLTGARDPAIVNPAKMTGPESALACGQCHSLWAFETPEARRTWNREGLKSKPGDPALSGRFIVQPTTTDHLPAKQALLQENPHFFEDTCWPDGMVRVVGREYNGVQASPCFKGGKFSCISCHEMHPEKVSNANLKNWAPNQMKASGGANAACLTCHQTIGENLSAHTHHAADSVGSQCYDCHMPHTGFGLLRAVRSHQVSSPNLDESIKLGRPNACNLCHLDKTLSWTADKLESWYGKKAPALSLEDHQVATGVKWLVRGDAGQRALVAWSMGWAPAQKASGREWMTPYLAAGLVDPYAAVRFVVGKSLQTMPGYSDFTFDASATRPQIKGLATQAFEQWKSRNRGKMSDFEPAVMIQPDGTLISEVYERLLSERDNRPMFLVE